MRTERKPTQVLGPAYIQKSEHEKFLHQNLEMHNKYHLDMCARKQLTERAG